MYQTSTLGGETKGKIDEGVAHRPIHMDSPLAFLDCRDSTGVRGLVQDSEGQFCRQGFLVRQLSGGETRNIDENFSRLSHRKRVRTAICAPWDGSEWRTDSEGTWTMPNRMRGQRNTTSGSLKGRSTMNKRRMVLHE